MGYILVNPRMSGSDIKSSKKNSSEAAEDIWTKLSSNIKNYTPKFYFSIQEAGGSKLSHYVIKESVEKTKDGNSRVKYSLKEFKGKKIDNKSLLNEIKQEGGKKHKYNDDSSSSSSSSSELVFTFPAGKTHKDMLLTYYPTIYGVPNVVLPTFVSSFAPFYNIKLIPNMVVITP